LDDAISDFLLREKNDNDECPEMFFLRSLLPDMEKTSPHNNIIPVSPHLKLLVKLHMAQNNKSLSIKVNFISSILSTTTSPTRNATRNVEQPASIPNSR
jgi:hypothetical protein